MTEQDSTQVLIIGAGLMGSAAAHQLAVRGTEVTVVERDTAASEHGSSHGSARIFRYAYPDPFYTRLVDQARGRYDELERLAGQQLITPGGALDFGTLRDPRHLAGVLDEVGIDHELLPASAAAERWPGINFDTEVLWQPGGGVIDAESTVRAQLRLATDAGARLIERWEAASIRRDGTSYVVTSTTGATIRAAQVVIAAGAWLSKLLVETELPSAFIDRLPQAVVTQENAYHFPYRDAADIGEPKPGAPTSWPTFIHKSERILTYSLPGGRDANFRGQKLAEFLGGTPITDGSTQTGEIDPANRERIIDYVREQVPGLVPEPYAETTCLFTMLPEEDFLLDAAEGLVIASPCSGHGAKFAPLLGEFIAELVFGATAHPRFAVTSPAWAVTR
ncbi:FAD-dependent oxidoreductase [Gulosibacter sp. ACHW.36C]|uniref:FAD-dependent oxidoreductase n=1 Tax=Gulosibacter sediminis TaxID=1729695 RepID=A0ABY4MWH2_9MICO|nr:FAD-dependent oxidoreductase [Gulosibacter sediminis]UQN14065.1 FAD-dependent oxidoreductase [Gulosibacter sediminis]